MSSTSKVLWIVAAWFAVTFVAGIAGVFDSGGEPPVALGLAVAVPVAIVLALLAWSAGFRRWVGGLDLATLTMLQSWRMIGFAFLAVWSVDRLPGSFALPAGLGDVLVGVAAPLVAISLAKPYGRRLFYAWTAVGILDLLIAIPLGIVTRLEADMTAMATVPMSLIPTFVVPLALALHVISLANARSSQHPGARVESDITFTH